MNIFDNIIALLKQKENFAIATIIDRSGSAPRNVGTRMLIRKDQTIIGTIGGGILEAKIQQLAAKVLSGQTPIVEQFILSAEDSSNMGMICGGEVRVMIQYIDATDPFNLEFYQTVSEAQNARRKAWMVTTISGDTPSAQLFIPVEGEILKNSAALALDDFIPENGRSTIVDHNGMELLVEPLNNDGTVYIFGAGHISQKLAPLTRMVGFYTIVLDDRKAFANKERFQDIDEIRVLPNFDSALNNLTIDTDTYLVIVTRGHSHDKIVLKQALKSIAGYIGMIGSRRKRNDIYTALKVDGFKENDFKRVFSPIGLNICAETPEEIALSIVAEMICERAKKRQSFSK